MEGRGNIDMAVTLSVRNTDRDQKIIIRYIDLYDTGGKLEKHYIENPISIPPMGTVDFKIAKYDLRALALDFTGFEYRLRKNRWTRRDDQTHGHPQRLPQRTYRPRAGYCFPWFLHIITEILRLCTITIHLIVLT